MKLINLLTILPAIIKFSTSQFSTISGTESPMEFAQKTSAESECPNLLRVKQEENGVTNIRYQCSIQNKIVKQNIPAQYSSTGVTSLTFSKPCTLKMFIKCPLTE